MNDFYKSSIKPYADRIKQYLTGEEFAKFFKTANGRYVYDNYYYYFIKHTVGGKCIRGYLVYLFNRLFGGEENDKLLKTAAAFEVFESAVLMHDDIIDRGRVRRGMPSAYVALGDNSTGESRAICLGDVGLLTSLALIDDTNNFDLEKYLTRLFLCTISGELQDVDISAQTYVTEDEIVSMYIEKTATYTVIAPAMSAALLNNAPVELLNDLISFSTNAGIAFQIKDDILGIFGKDEQTGKKGSSDITEGKKTILSAHFNENATDEQKAIFYSVYGNKQIDSDGVQTIRQLFEQTNSKAHAEKTMENCFKIATESLNKLFEKVNPDERIKAEICDFILFLKNRIK